MDLTTASHVEARLILRQKLCTKPIKKTASGKLFPCRIPTQQVTLKGRIAVLKYAVSPLIKSPIYLENL